MSGSSSGRVSVSSNVLFKELGGESVLLNLDNDQELTYELVVPEMANPEEGQLSIASPIGKSLLGKRAEDEVTIETPAGRKNFELLELVTIHQKGQT